MHDKNEFPLPRQIADEYLDALATLDPLTATMLGMEAGRDRLPDLSPAGADATNDLAVRTLARLDASEAAGGADSPEERRCARLLRERLNASIGLYESQEHLRSASNLYSPIHQVRQVFTIMPTNDERDWAAVAARMRALPEALDGYRASLQEGLNRGLPAGPLQITTMLEQFTEWAGESGGDGGSWFAGLVAGGPDTMSEDLREAAATATSGLISLRDWLRDSYAPAVAGASDAVGRERYAVWARYWNGSEPDLDETYAWGWQEFLRIQQEMVLEADKVLPGAGPLEAMSHLDSHGETIKGADAARQYLQTLMDQVIEELNDTHFDLAAPLRQVEAMIAPAGSAPAPYYTPPSLDFSRPGRTWLPSRDTERFPLWDLIDMWYHEGVPGHHLQLGQWVYVADRLSRYQASLVAAVGANVEGWALYSERLMDELGYFTDPGRRLGYLNAQLWRASRVIVDIGMHLELRIPDESPFRPGEVWSRETALEFFAAHSGLSPAMREGEITRYLGLPGQAISYKLGERAWLAGREAARAAHGADFDLKAWHMAALSLGSLGLDDLTDELSRL
ncbi:DUF885 domain-containing protein [Streptomyces flaveolus]|uniref:DUF885 domain-containing protein n=1 Tax=Streptomyces flaveolus TaxID=67297 RepID=UPI0033E9B205